MRNIISFFCVYTSDSSVRRNVGAFFGIFINSFYILINLIWGIKHLNVWFITVAVYHLLILFMRYFSIDTSGAEGRGELVGALMTVLSIPITGMIAYTVLTSSARGYPKSSLPVFAGYAIFSIFRAVYGLLSVRRDGAPSLRATHSIRLSLALMSLFNLQTSLFAFLKFDSQLAVFFNFLTGGAASISVLALARQRL